jgi:hypothetical protein
MKYFLYVLTLSLLLYACDDNESTPLGANFFQDAALDVSVLDTVSVKLATVQYEKLITNSTTRLLIGYHDDETLGAVTSSTWFELTSPGSSSLTTSNSTYNFLVLVLKYDDYSFYDTSTVNTLDVYRVAEEMDADDDGYLYNHSHFAIRPDKLGSFSFKPKPHADSIAIKLDDALGLDLYNKLLNKADEITDQTKFLKYLRGLAIFPDSTTSGSMVGFTKKADLRLYYVDKSVVPANRDTYISFPLTDNGKLFNHIYSDRTGTALGGKLSDKKERLDASQTNQQAYIQAGSGLALRVDFPYVKNLLDTKNFYITNAVLRIYPPHGSYDDLMPLPSTLTSYVVYADNSIYTSFSAAVRLTAETELPRDSYYTVDVTSFIQSLIVNTGNKDDQNGLLFQLSDGYSTSASRLFAGTTKTSLTIYFATIKNN